MFLNGKQVLNNVKTNVSEDKNLFLIKLANDFKSPLQSIVGFSQAIADGLGGEISEQQDKYIRIIKKNSSGKGFVVNFIPDIHPRFRIKGCSSARGGGISIFT